MTKEKWFWNVVGELNYHEGFNSREEALLAAMKAGEDILNIQIGEKKVPDIQDFLDNADICLQEMSQSFSNAVGSTQFKDGAYPAFKRFLKKYLVVNPHTFLVNSEITEDDIQFLLEQELLPIYFYEGKWFATHQEPWIQMAYIQSVDNDTWNWSTKTYRGLGPTEGTARTYLLAREAAESRLNAEAVDTIMRVLGPLKDAIVTKSEADESVDSYTSI